MAWEVNDEEFRSVLALSGNQRYEYFVKRVAGHGEVWGLRDEGGWVVAADEEEGKHFPVWPHSRFAEACAGGLWAAAEPAAIDIDEWVEGWLTELEKDGMRVAVFQTPQDLGVGVAPQRLKRDLDDELSRFEL